MNAPGPPGTRETAKRTSPPNRFHLGVDGHFADLDRLLVNGRQVRHRAARVHGAAVGLERRDQFVNRRDGVGAVGVVLIEARASSHGALEQVVDVRVRELGVLSLKRSCEMVRVELLERRTERVGLGSGEVTAVVIPPDLQVPVQLIS